MKIYAGELSIGFVLKICVSQCLVDFWRHVVTAIAELLEFYIEAVKDEHRTDGLDQH